MKLIERTMYLDKLKSVIGTPDIKVITGVRRCGKSKLLEAFKTYLEKEVENANIIHINYNLSDFEELKEYHALNEYIKDRYISGKENFILIDEIQMCPEFELTINSVHASEQYDIYITGSNAFLLSSDLATLFTGRYIEIPVLPFSFAEYRTYYGEKEIIGIKKSAEMINRTISASSLVELPSMYHGDFSVNHAELYAETVKTICK